MDNQSRYPLVSLGMVLKQDMRYVTELESRLYPKLSVRLYGKGVVLDTPTDSASVRMSRHQLARPGQVILSEIWAKKGAIGIVPREGEGALITSHFFLFDIEWGLLSPGYMKWLVEGNYFEQQLWVQARGTTGYAAIRPRQFLELKIPLPPLAEQQRIVARIDALAARIEEAKGLRAQAVAEAEAILRNTASRLVEQVAETPSRLDMWLDSERQGIQTGPFGAQLGSGDFVDTGIPLITIGNVQYTGLELDALRYVTQQKADELVRYDVQEGDILFARMGTVGRCCVVPAWASGWLYNYHLIRVVLDKSKVVPRYVHWSIQASQDIETYLDESIRGATRQGVNQKIVAGLPVRIPSLDEQQRIVAYLDDLQTRVDAVKRLQAETQAELDALLPAVLDRAFRGEL